MSVESAEVEPAPARRKRSGGGKSRRVVAARGTRAFEGPPSTHHDFERGAVYAHGVGAQSPPSKLHVSTLHAGSHSPSFTQLAGHERVHRSFCGVTSEPLAKTQSPMSQPHA